MTKISVVSLGCAKNLVLSEQMMAQLTQQGFTLTDDYSDAEIIVINTCGFINDAKEESINTILDMAQLKESGCCRVLVVVGCLVQKYAYELAEELPEVDILIGTNHYDDIGELLTQYEQGGQERIIQVDNMWRPEKNVPSERLITTPDHYAYLRIAEGCDNHCTYCVIPQMQGPYRSRPLESILSEAEQLANEGYSEIILVAQDTTYYGYDLYGHFALAELLKALAQIEKLRWIRLLYAYPNNFTDELIEVIASETKICKYLDIPLQHSDDIVLKRMNRQITQVEIKQLLQKLRDKMPDIVLRSTFIVGFPGESDEQFQNLLDFLTEVRLDRVGAFPYSQEEGTSAAMMDGQIDDDEKERRATILMDHQYDIMYHKHKSWIGREILVKVDEVSEDVEHLLLCRSQGEAPDVDPFVLVYGDTVHQVGDYFMVKITGVDEYDYIGEMIS